MKYLCGMCFISEVSQLDLLECAFVDVFQSNDIIIRSFMKMSVVMWYECCFEKFLVVRLCGIDILQKTLLQNIQICNNILWFS